MIPLGVIPLIAKIPEKRSDGQSSFRDLVDYCRKCAEYTNSQGIRDPENAAEEMEIIASLNGLCADPVFHFMLSWRETEFPTPEQTDEAVAIALKELGLQDCQAFWALQSDTDNRHAHVAVNRIEPETGRIIQPAGGWTKKALERAARKIEIAQGWDVLEAGRYVVTADGEVIEKHRNGDESPKLSQTARDIEAHTAAKSAERIGQETAFPIIREAKSWEELHQKLAEHGIQFERKGSGAILHIGKATIKASQVGRDMSLSKLEKRLGEYQQRDASVVIHTSLVEPIERVEESQRVKRSWADYQEAKGEYLKSKHKALSDFRTRHKEEQSALNSAHRQERNRLMQSSWRGKGAELNKRRSLMAAEQQKAKLDLRDRQERERKELRKRFPSSFPNFKTWLEQENDPELSVMYRYAEDLVLTGNSQNPAARHEDLRDFAARSGNKGGVAYFRKKGFFTHAAFVDYGRKILIDKKCDEASILAAFQLASQKWGAVQINGSEEYKRMCVEVAIKHNFKIANPDLNTQVQTGRAEAAKTAAQQEKYFHTREQAKEKQAQAAKLFDRYADAVDAERFRITATEFTPEGTKAFILDKNSGGQNGKTREEVVSAIPRLQHFVKYDKNIYVTPLSDDKHHVLVDDLTEEKLQKIKDDGYSPSCVIESSPGSFQAVFTIPKLGLEPEKERSAANRLVRELNKEYGDPKLTGAIHAHRLPPFPNLKPKHKNEDGISPETTLIEANGGVCPKALNQLRDIRGRMDREEERQRQSVPSIGTGELSVNAREPDGAYWAHYRDIVSKVSGELDYSGVDGKIGIRMRLTGYSSAQILEAIRNNASAMRKETMSEREHSSKYHGRDWDRYARETAEKFVFGERGRNQYAKSEAYRPYYMKVEGRSLTEEQQLKTKKAEKAEKNLGR